MLSDAKDIAGGIANAYVSDVTNVDVTTPVHQDPGAYNLGRKIGHAVAAVQGVDEMVQGGTGVVEGVAGAPETLGATLTLSAGGFVVAAHGAMIIKNAFVNMASGKGDDKGGSPNPYGSKGNPDHQQKVKDLEKQAQQEAKPGETVLTERKIQGHDSNRRPDVQIVDESGKAREIKEAERKPSSTRNKKREAEYDKLGVNHQTHKVGN